MKKKEDREELSIDYLGKTYLGYRIIKGTRKLTQTVYYESHHEHDGHAYKPNEDARMIVLAERLLRELVELDQEN